MSFKPLKDLVKIKGGKRLPKGESLQTESNSHPYIRIRDMGGRYLPRTGLEFVPDVVFPKIKNYIVNTNDVIISIVGTIGLVSVIDEYFDNASQTENCAKLSGLDNIDAQFMYYSLISRDGQQAIAEGTVGAVQPKLPLYNIEKIEIFWPNRGEREKIVNSVGKLDDKIALNTQINQTLEAMAQALFKSWFVDFDPVKAKMEARASGGSDDAVRRAAMAVISGKSNEELVQFEQENPEAFGQLAETADLFPEALVESELGFASTGLSTRIPEGWEVKTAESIVTRHKVVQKFTNKNVLPEGETIVYDQSSNLILGYSDAPADFMSSLESPKFFFGDHTCVTHISTKPFSVGPNVIPLSHKTHNPYWTFYAIKDLQTFQEYRRHWMEFKVKELVCPDKEIAERFGHKVKSIHAMLEFNSENTRMLAKTRDTLLPKLLSGEIDLSSFGAREVGE